MFQGESIGHEAGVQGGCEEDGLKWSNSDPTFTLAHLEPAVEEQICRAVDWWLGADLGHPLVVETVPMYP